jgi:iron complex transport system substrate-binding protein
LKKVYLQSAKADYWLNIGSVLTKSDIEAFDPRLASIAPFINNNLYNNNNRISPGSGNDYWESGTLNPQVILKDIASILHPELFTKFNLFYYRKIN